MGIEQISGYLEDSGLRRSFNALAGEVFGLDFEPWYRQGWSGKYRPYSIVVDGQVVSNVSVNDMDCLLNGEARRYKQLGTVMTKPEYRGRGYCRRLMEQALEACQGCDGVFLYANDSVLAFYPRFGFRPAEEYRYRADLTGARAAAVRQVSMAGLADRFPAGQGQGVLRLDNPGLLMFYLTGPMGDKVFYHPASGAYIAAGLAGDLLTVYGVFAPRPVDLLALCRAFGPRVGRVEFAFTPADRRGLEEFRHKEEDTTLFLLGQPLSRDMAVLRAFPELAHA